MSARNDDLVMIAGVRMGKWHAMALAAQKMRDAGVDIMVMDGPGLIRPLEPEPIQPLTIRERPPHTHPNSPKATRRHRRGRR